MCKEQGSKEARGKTDVLGAGGRKGDSSGKLCSLTEKVRIVEVRSTRRLTSGLWLRILGKCC